MTALKNLVRKVRQAVVGDEGETPARPFTWEPAPIQATAAGAAAAQAAPAEATARSKRAESEPSGPARGLVGGAIPADVSDFATVYKAAGVQAPTHGYGVDRVSGMLTHKSLSGLDRSVKASAVLAALDAAGVPLADVVQDATLRYKALVAFEAAKDLELQGIRPGSEQRVERLRADAAAFEAAKKAEIDALTRETSEAMNAIARLRTRKRAEEERFHRAVSMFVEALPGRVIPMAPKPAEEPKSEAKPDLKLVTDPAQKPTGPLAAKPPESGAAPGAPAADATVAFKPAEPVAAAEAEPAKQAPDAAPADAPAEEREKD